MPYRLLDTNDLSAASRLTHQPGCTVVQHEPSELRHIADCQAAGPAHRVVNAADPTDPDRQPPQAAIAAPRRHRPPRQNTRVRRTPMRPPAQAQSPRTTRPADRNAVRSHEGHRMPTQVADMHQHRCGNVTLHSPRRQRP